jgi:hypothetical protein
MSWVKSLGRAAGIGIVLFGVITVLGKLLMLNASWPQWAVAAGAGLAAEVIWLLYRYERGVVSQRRGRWLVGLRLAALAVVVWVLLEPVWSRHETRDLRREVVLVWDESASMDLVDDGAGVSRLAAAEQAVTSSGLREKLGKGLKVREIRVARGVRSEADTRSDGWDSATDLVGALESVLDQTSPDQLAGVVMMTDGRHNRGGRVEDVARRFGILDAPIGVVAVGSGKAPRDLALISVDAPDAVFLGDRLRVRAVVKIDGYAGESVKVALWRGDELVGERELVVNAENFREEVRFQDVPEADGVTGYRVELAGRDGERFSENNVWRFETAVTEDRTNVLLIEGFPRWEFRYLRNLFYGRDRSVHLQYVLQHPETIEGQVDEVIPASAGREFRESRATRLPATEEEWRKFDVILLGDVGPDLITDEVWEIIRRCVTERGAMLGVMAGPRAMPHAHTAQAARELLPVTWVAGEQTYFDASADFRMRLTAAGSGHSVTAQSESQIENENLWAGFPVLRWRHPGVSVKPGAEVLLYAGPVEDGTVAPTDARQLGDALGVLAARQQAEKDRAILVTSQAGLGKVAAVLTDHTWRLREGAGDIFHHRLWGQLTRWGAGPNLRGGSGGARIGTDRLGYAVDDEVKLTARLRDKGMAPLTDEEVEAELWRDGKRVSSVPLAAVAGSPGIYEAKTGPLEAGRYEVVLAGDKVESLSESGQRVVAGISVGANGVPVELSETTRDSQFLGRAAEMSGGRVVEVAEAGSLAELFIKERVEREELRETRLWDWWPLVVVFAGLVITEWSLRRNAGLP